MNITDKISAHIEAEKWGQARKLLVQELDKNPEDHWCLTSLSTTYYEEKDYSTALELTQGALELAPHCPLVLWDHACALDMTGHKEEAIQVWKSLLKKNVDSIAHNDCGEGIRWARSLLNDCRYRIARAYLDLKKMNLARRYISQHLKARAPGRPSVYSLKEARELEKRVRRS